MALSTYFQNSGAKAGTGAEVGVTIPAGTRSMVLLAVTQSVTYAWSSGGTGNVLPAGSALPIENANLGSGTIYLTQAAGGNAYLTYEIGVSA